MSRAEAAIVDEQAFWTRFDPVTMMPCSQLLACHVVVSQEFKAIVIQEVTQQAPRINPIVACEAVDFSGSESASSAAFIKRKKRLFCSVLYACMYACMYV